MTNWSIIQITSMSTYNGNNYKLQPCWQHSTPAVSGCCFLFFFLLSYLVIKWGCYFLLSATTALFHFHLLQCSQSCAGESSLWAKKKKSDRPISLSGHCEVSQTQNRSSSTIKHYMGLHQLSVLMPISIPDGLSLPSWYHVFWTLHKRCSTLCVWEKMWSNVRRWNFWSVCAPPSVVFLVKFEGPQRAAGGLEQHSAVLRSTLCIRQWAALQKQRLWLSGQKPVPVNFPENKPALLPRWYTAQICVAGERCPAWFCVRGTAPPSGPEPRPAAAAPPGCVRWNCNGASYWSTWLRPCGKRDRGRRYNILVPTTSKMLFSSTHINRVMEKKKNCTGANMVIHILIWVAVWI